MEKEEEGKEEEGNEEEGKDEGVASGVFGEGR